MYIVKRIKDVLHLSRYISIKGHTVNLESVLFRSK